MAIGTCMKCLKCGKSFRIIYGFTSEELINRFGLFENEREKFKGNEFVCCGKEHLKSLYDLGLNDELVNLQSEFMLISMRSL